MPGRAITVDAAFSSLHAKAEIALHSGSAVFVAFAFRGWNLNTDAVEARLPILAVTV